MSPSASIPLSPPKEPSVGVVFLDDLLDSRDHGALRANRWSRELGPVLAHGVWPPPHLVFVLRSLLWPPIHWRRRGELLVAESVTEHALRALFFQYTGLYGGSEDECLHASEESRGNRATVALGPDAAQRYVVGFDANTWRVRGEQAERIGSTGDGWAVYDATHRAVRRGPERLWSGWHRWLLLEDEGGLLHRLDLDTDEREDLGAPGRSVDACLAIPGTPNMLLVAVGDGLRVRVV